MLGYIIIVFLILNVIHDFIYPNKIVSNQICALFLLDDEEAFNCWHVVPQLYDRTGEESSE